MIVKDEKYIQLAGGEFVSSLPLIINEIKENLIMDCYLGALALSLIIPDICGQIEFPQFKKKNGQRLIGKQYETWFNKWIGQYEKNLNNRDGMPYMSGELIYALRCSFLHAGNDDVSDEYKDFTLNNFILKMEEKNEFDTYIDSACIITDNDGEKYSYIRLDVRNICNKIVMAAEKFIEENEWDDNQLPKLAIIDWDKTTKKFNKLMKRNDN